MKTLYVVSTWSGERDGLSFDDSYAYRHINHLGTLPNNLSQISVGDPDNPSKRPHHKKFLSEIQKTGDTSVVVHPMPNAGRSYGQWSRIYEKYRTEFDYYIFIEDDYVPVLANFDSVLIEMFDKAHAEKNCGFLCGLVLEPNDGRYGKFCTEAHAGISNGISSSAVLEKVYQQFGCLPHDKTGYLRGQIDFSQGFIKAGFTLADYLSDEYRCLYFQHNTTIRIYGPNAKAKDIISPIQCLETQRVFEYRHLKEGEIYPAQIKRHQKRRIPRIRRQK